MSYSKFKRLDDVLSAFSLRWAETTGRFAAAPPAPLAPAFVDLLGRWGKRGLATNTEKARSESMIAPLLMEAVELHGRSGIFSGIEFNVDPALGLSGRCDFLLGLGNAQYVLQAPVVVVVEAKNENIPGEFGQCVAGMVAAQKFNAQKGHPTRFVYGAVTSGDNWAFLQLENDLVLVDYQEELISHPATIAGVILMMLRSAESAFEASLPSAVTPAVFVA